MRIEHFAVNVAEPRKMAGWYVAHLGVGLMDTVCPPSTQFAAYNKITSKKTLSIFPDSATRACLALPIRFTCSWTGCRRC